MLMRRFFSAMNLFLREDDEDFLQTRRRRETNLVLFLFSSFKLMVAIIRISDKKRKIYKILKEIIIDENYYYFKITNKNRNRNELNEKKGEKIPYKTI